MDLILYRFRRQVLPPVRLMARYFVRLKPLVFRRTRGR